MKRQRTLQKCAGKFTRELNIDQILKKVRDTYAAFTNLPMSRELQPYIKFNQNNIVELTDSEDENYRESGEKQTQLSDTKMAEAEAVINGDDNQFNYFNDTPNSSFVLDESLDDAKL